MIPIFLKPIELYDLLTGRTEIIRNQRVFINMLSNEIGSRSFSNYTNLQKARKYIFSSLAAAGASPTEDPYYVGNKEVANVVAEIRGFKHPNDIIVVGAHYDTVEESTGANDNASGVAALLELYRLIAQRRLKRTVRFVAFTLEEPPFFMTEQMGSFVYAKKCMRRNENIAIMVNLDMIGYGGTFKKQNFPMEEMKKDYPTKGNYLIAGSLPSYSKEVHRCKKLFNRHAKQLCHEIILPASYAGIADSDHISFIKNGYPGVLFSDTGIYRNENYHTENDRYETINFKFLAENTYSLYRMILDLANCHRIV